MSEVTEEQKQSGSQGSHISAFGPKPASGPAASYYTPAAVSAMPPEGPIGPQVPMSSRGYNAADHVGSNSVNIYVRGTNSGGMTEPEVPAAAGTKHQDAKHHEYFSQGAMDDFDSVLAPEEAARLGRNKVGPKKDKDVQHLDNQLHSEFDWYGGLDNTLARRVAGRKLLTEQVLPAWEDGKTVNLAAHSHGGNVVNEFGGEVEARTQYTQALSGGLGAKPGSPEFKAAQAALSQREALIRNDLAEFQTKYGKRPTGGEAELFADLRKEMNDITRDKKGLAGTDPAATAALKQRTATESAALQKGKLGNIAFMDTPFRNEHDPLMQNPEFRNRAQNIYNIYNPDDFVVRNLAGKNTLGGDQQYPGFGAFGRNFEVGTEASYTLPEGGNIHNIAWHHQNRNFVQSLTGSHSDLIGGADEKDAGMAAYREQIRTGITDKIRGGKSDGPDVAGTDLRAKTMRGLFGNLQKNSYRVDDQAAMDPVTGELGAHREGVGARADLPQWSKMPYQSSRALFGDISGKTQNRLGEFSGGVGDVRSTHPQVGLELSHDGAENDIMSGTLRRTSGVDNLRGSAKTGLGDASFSAGTINKGFEGRVSQITNPSGLKGYTADASFGGVRARDLNTETNIGGVHNTSHVGGIDTNTLVSGGYITQPDGSKAVVGGGSWGGVRMNDLQTRTETDKVVAEARLGSFSNANGVHGRTGWDGTNKRYFAEGGGDYGDTSLKDFQAGVATKDGKAFANGGFGSLRVGGVEGGGHVDYDPKTGQVHAQGGGRGGGFNLDNAQTSYGVKGLGRVDASVGNVTTDTVVENAQFNGSLRKGEASVGHMEGMGISAKDGKITSQNDLLGIRQDASFKSLGNSNSIDGARANYDFTNLRDPRLGAGFKSLSYGAVSGEKLHYGMKGPGGVNLDANLGGLQTSMLNLADGRIDLSKDGLDASVGKSSYDAVALKDLDVSGGAGKLANYQAKLGEGRYNHFGADSASVQLNKDGLSTSMRNGNYRYLDGKKVELNQSLLNGAVGSSTKADEVSVGGVDIGKLRTNSTLRNANLDAEGIGAHGVKVKNLDASQHVGSVGTSVQAKQVNALDLNVGKIHAATQNFGTKGNASVDNATLDAVKIEDGHAGLSVKGKELVGATGSYQSGLGLKHAEGSYDALHGKASGQVKDLSAGGQLHNASVNVMGNKIALPDMGGKVNVNAGGNVDLFKGQAQGNLGLGGSSMNFGSHKVTVPEFVQASGGVDLAHGGVNANLGGKNGVGADVNLSQGKVDVNMFGHHVDVVQGTKNAVNAVGSGAKKAWHSLTSWL